MIPFIEAKGNVLYINGNASEAPRTRFYDEEAAVQLHRVNEDDPLDLEGIDCIVARKVTIYDDKDLAVLRLFLLAEKQLDFSKAWVAPDALPGLIHLCRNLPCNAPFGSTIQLPFPHLANQQTLDQAKQACQNIHLNLV